jgi:hypothetical protein
MANLYLIGVGVEFLRMNGSVGLGLLGFLTSLPGGWGYEWITWLG